MRTCGLGYDMNGSGGLGWWAGMAIEKGKVPGSFFLYMICIACTSLSVCTIQYCDSAQALEISATTISFYILTTKTLQ